MKITCFVSILLVLTVGYFFHKESILDNSNALIDSKDQCTQQALSFFEEMGRINIKLDYSFANNDSSLEDLLDKNYSYITTKDNNCFALVKNYNPSINEYRYSILNVDIQKFEAILIEHELDDNHLKESFYKKYSEVFKN